MNKIKSLIITAMFLVSLFAAIAPVYAQNYVHNINTGEDFATVQNAIDDSNTLDGHTITIDAVTLDEWCITVDKDLTIKGAGAGLTTIDGNAHDSVFKISSGTTATILDMTITNGNSDSNYGGGIYNEGTLTMENCTVSDNYADYDGGGIYNEGTLTMENCTVSGNSAGNYGGGIYNSHTLTMTNCTVSGNSAWNGGGINNDGGTLTMTNCTVSNNDTTWDGGGIDNNDTVYAKNTIIANNTVEKGTGPDFRGVISSYGYNLIGDTTDCTINESANPSTNITGVNPMLGPLQNNGGSTETHALLSGSPAIDAGDCTDKDSNPVLTDQRGVSRPQGSRCDIGAYEYPQMAINPILVFLPVKNYHLRQVNAYLECITENLPEDVPGDVQTLLDEMQEHIDNANTTGNSIYANNELLKALKCAEDIQEILGITCPL